MKKVGLIILSKLYRYGQLTNNVFFKIFDTKVLPILMYGAEIWGIQARQEVERVQHYACKRYLCARQNSTNDAVMGDCGRYPLYVTMANRVIRYWIKITKMQDHRYVKKSRGGHSLVSSVPMRDQRIVEHTLNSVIDI